MKKHIVIILTTTFLFTFSSIFYACTQDEISEKKKEQIELENFEDDIHTVFTLINQDLSKSQSSKKLKIKHLFLRALSQVFPEKEAEESFLRNFGPAREVNRQAQRKSRAAQEMEKLVASFNDENHAIQALEAHISSDAHSNQEKRNFIVLKESIIFLSINKNILFESLYYLNNKSKSSLAKCGWWDSWGQCAAGAFGAALAGVGTGCWAGSNAGIAAGPYGAAGGCVAGAVIGGISGALTGAAASCEGCDD